MKKRYLIDPSYGRMLKAIGIDCTEALRLADAPEDTFSHQSPSMSIAQYYRFMEAVGKLAPQPNAAVVITSVQGIEQFSPPIFASFCSPNGRTCITRLARYKKLVGPMRLNVIEKTDTFTIELTCEEPEPEMPMFLVEVELAFLVNIMRTATKEKILPRSIEMKQEPESKNFENFMGCRITYGGSNHISFSISDMEKPFISRNDAMWNYFEPELARRLAEMGTDDSFAAHVRSALTELLPAGECGADSVARKLGVSRRTLQRRLKEEDGTTFQKQLNNTRQLLAEHYLKTTAMPADQIAYLLGYAELNSFLRAFSSWTGCSVGKYRSLSGKR